MLDCTSNRSPLPWQPLLYAFRHALRELILTVLVVDTDVAQSILSLVDACKSGNVPLEKLPLPASFNHYKFNRDRFMSQLRARAQNVVV